MSDATPPFSPALLALLKRHLGAVVGPMELMPSLADMVAESRGEEWHDPAAHGIWLIGTAVNGDAWAIDVNEGEQVVVVSHDLVWEDEVETLRDATCVVAANLAEALEEARSNTLPVDYFSAIEGESLDEPDSKLTFGPGGMDAGLSVPPAARAAMLGALFGPDTGVTWDELEEAFFQLEPTERAVLASRYGLFGGKPTSAEGTAKALGLEADTVAAEEARGLRWLKRLVAKVTKG
ncbi:MAG: hypothetical protein Q8P41_20715 [Pseudomonadota bacterium]|nr:hypothetical protein [Pseudomonadota bacterium]